MRLENYSWIFADDYARKARLMTKIHAIKDDVVVTSKKKASKSPKKKSSIVSHFAAKKRTTTTTTKTKDAKKKTKAKRRLSKKKSAVFKFFCHVVCAQPTNFTGLPFFTCISLLIKYF